MEEIILTPKKQAQAGLEGGVITPDSFAGKTLGEIRNLEVLEGNKKAKLGDYFSVNGKTAKDPENQKITINGDVSKTKNIGRDMTGGIINIKGSAGMYVGRNMKGGKLIVNGDVGPFSGQEMGGGELIVKGDSGDYLGCAYRGDWRGMRGGSILVEGKVGNEVGEYMMGGKITINGDAGFFVGLNMKKGLIVVNGKAPGRVGASMHGGSIVISEIANLMPSFKPEGEEVDPEIDGELFKGRYLKYSGDYAERDAKGMLYLKKG
ncbi:MAG: formylmethanofuran dehydrogenase subunit C [Candidatus Hydrothermarchaeales archaeon]